MSEDHERRIAELERSRTEQWEKINAMYAMVKVLYDRADRAPVLPCAEHKAELSRLDERLRIVESTGNRFVGAWDFGKVAFGASIPVAIFFLGKLL